MPRPRTLRLEGTSLHPSFFEDKVQRVLEPLRTPADEEQVKLCSPLLSEVDIVDIDSLVFLLRRAAGDVVDFATREIRNFNSFFTVLQVRNDGLSKYFWQRLSPETKTLQSADLDTPAHRQRVLGLFVKDLNRIVRGGLIFNRKRDTHFELASDTLELLEEHPTGTGLIRLNRMLLEDAFPAWLKSPRPSPAVVFLWNQLSNSTKALVRNWGTTRSDLLRVGLVEDLNRLIRSGPLFEAQRFVNETLSTCTEALLKTNPHGDDLMKLNRLLLEDALPYKIRSNIYLRMSQADLDEFLVFPLALFEAIASFVEDPASEQHMWNFSLAWRIEPRITEALLTAIGEYVQLPATEWTVDRRIIQYLPDGENKLPSWRESAKEIEDTMQILHGVKRKIQWPRQRVEDIKRRRTKVLEKWKSNTAARDRWKREGIEEPWFYHL